MRSDELGQCLAQLIDAGRAGAQHFGRGGIVQQREEQMLDRDELVALLARLDERHVQADFQLLRDHSWPFAFTYVGSITHCNGCWCFREYAATCCTLVVATSFG